MATDSTLAVMKGEADDEAFRCVLPVDTNEEILAVTSDKNELDVFADLPVQAEDATGTSSHDKPEDDLIRNSNDGIDVVDVSAAAKADEQVEMVTSTSSEQKQEEAVTPKNSNQSASPLPSETEPKQGRSSHDTASSRSPDKILSLPMDALHGIASFLTPTEWCHSFGMLNRASHTVSRVVVHRVRMHGFKCATEIATAWKLGFHEDARELAILYVGTGVPVYPRSLGYSLHTLLWKMQVEVKGLEAKEQVQDAQEEPFRVDPFFRSRAEFRTSEGVSSDMTYLEIKSLFFMQKDGEKTQARPSLSARTRNASPVRDLIESRLQSPSTPSKSANDLPTHKKKLPLTIHQHLLHQHLQGRECADDWDGKLVTPPVSLSADYYHPQSAKRRSYSNQESYAAKLPSALEDAVAQEDDESTEGQVANQRSLNPMPARVSGRLETGDDISDPISQRSPFRDHSVLDFLDLEVYSASSIPSYKPQHLPERKTVERSLQSRFDSYQRRLETFLARSDNIAYEECLLDFWDEIFPLSAGFQYYDRHTAVPRISRLQDFLTKPCPRSVGIVQCEIERVKTTSRGKGVSMKGRLFPTYEYRLFIRNRPHNPLTESTLTEDDDFIRRDTVLMVAKNRGRKRTESSGIVTISSPKKGSNNYFLQMPQQMDVDAHFNKVNREDNNGRLNPNGAGHEPVLASNDASGGVLGRLQSNFIGTEFQIYVPRLKKRPLQKSAYFSPSDEELDYDSGVSSDNTSSRRSRFSRLSLRRSSTPSDALGDGPAKADPTFLRTTCSPDVQTRQGRANRRAIANTPDTPPQPQPPRAYLLEEEDGVITYTANLLGSRPRIMDVCIPKVSPDGEAGVEWRNRLSNCCEHEELEMLSAFRQLLQQIENQDQNAVPEGAGAEEGNPTPVDDFGLRALQNRPPWWNIELGSFVLNFGGRVSVASVKNFQLCDRDDQDKILLQFGRIQGRHSFTMDFQHPLTPVQAFSIAISSLQSKLSFG